MYDPILPSTVTLLYLAYITDETLWFFSPLPAAGASAGLVTPAYWNFGVSTAS